MKSYLLKTAVLLSLALGLCPDIAGNSEWMSDEGTSIREFVGEAQQNIKWAAEMLRPFVTNGNGKLIATFGGLSVGVWVVGSCLIDRLVKISVLFQR